MPGPDAAPPAARGAGSCPACWGALEPGRDVELARIGGGSPRGVDPPPGIGVPVLFHAGCSPSGWEVLAGPVGLDYALRIRGRMLGPARC